MTITKQKANIWQMAGTTNSGEYKVFAVSPRGRVGMRTLEGDLVRIRVEPGVKMGQVTRMAMNQTLTRKKGWKQPGDDEQNRWSTVVEMEKTEPLLKSICTLLGRDELKGFKFNPEFLPSSD